MENYELVSSLSKDKSGVVNLVKDLRNGERYAMKKIECSDETTANKALKEFAQLETQRYSFVPRYHEIFVSWDTKDFAVFLCIVMEYFPKGSLDDVLDRGLAEGSSSPLDSSVLQKWVGQLLKAAVHVHGDQIVHKNLKPSNVFLKGEKEDLLISDFGLSVLMTQEGTNKGLLDARMNVWCSPEAYQSKRYEERSDVWALGCLVLAMASCGGQINADELHMYLYQLKTNPEVLEKLLGNVTIVHGECLSGLIRSMMRRNIHQRPTALELFDDPYVVQSLEMVDSDLCHQLASPEDEEDVLLVKLLKAKNSVETQILLLKELVELAQTKESQLKSATEGCVVEILKQYHSHGDAQVLGLLALYMSRKGGDNSKGVDAAVLVSRTLCAAKTHHDNVELLLVATQLLAVLSEEEKARESLIESNVVSTIMMAMDSFPNHTELMTALCELLTRLITDDHIADCIALGGAINVMASTLKSYVHNNELVSAILPVVSFLSSSDKYLPLLLSSGMPGIVLEVMWVNKEDTNVVKFSCYILKILCDMQGEAVYHIMDLKSNGRGVENIVNILRLYDYDVAVVENISGLLKTMSKYDDVKYKVKALNIVEILSSVKRTLKSSEQIREELKQLIVSFVGE